MIIDNDDKNENVRGRVWSKFKILKDIQNMKNLGLELIEDSR